MNHLKLANSIPDPWLFDENVVLNTAHENQKDWENRKSSFENLRADCEIQVNLTWFKFLTL